MSFNCCHPTRSIAKATNWPWSLGAIVSVHILLLAWGASRQAPTFNEPAHLVAGVSYLKFARFDLYRENPPLIRLVAAIPVLVVDYSADWSGFEDSPGARPAFAMGENFVEANGPRFMWLLTLARWACLPFSVIGALTCYRWARDLGGKSAGLSACALWCGSPEILGHGQLVTPDVAASAMAVLASYAFWRWLRKPELPETVASGTLLGLAQLVKSTMLLLYFALPLCWLVVRLARLKQRGVKSITGEAMMMAVSILLSLNVVNLGYCFEGTFQRLDKFTFVSRLFAGSEGPLSRTKESNDHLDDEGMEDRVIGNRFRKTWLGRLPVPLPRNYIEGLDIQQADFEDFRRPSYLQGTFAPRGWWYYYVFGIAIRTPLALWGLAVLAIVRRLKTPVVGSNFDAETVLLITPLSLLVLASAKCGFSHHIRYVLPCLPFCICWVASTLLSTHPTSRPGAARTVAVRRIQGLSAILIVALWVESIMVYPHTLSFFNSVAGGPYGGPTHLLGSYVDWGQDLLFLKQRIEQIGHDEPVFVAYYGGSNPQPHRIMDWQPIESGLARDGTQVLVPGYYAISVNLLYGDPFPSRNPSSDWSKRRPDGKVPEPILKDLRVMKRFGSAGYSIYIYHVSRHNQRTP
jgi:hypothetical protein